MTYYNTFSENVNTFFRYFLLSFSAQEIYKKCADTGVDDKPRGGEGQGLSADAALGVLEGEEDLSIGFDLEDVPAPRMYQQVHGGSFGEGIQLVDPFHFDTAPVHRQIIVVSKFQMEIPDASVPETSVDCVSAKLRRDGNSLGFLDPMVAEGQGEKCRSHEKRQTDQKDQPTFGSFEYLL